MNDISSTTELCPTPADEFEDDLVFRWRLEQFSLLGFEVVEAVVLAGSGADLHCARKLIADGCPLGIALQILL
jgi:hypothetical protein